MSDSSELAVRKGIPLVRVTTKSIFDLVRVNQKDLKDTNTKATETFIYKGVKYVFWGHNNRFPDDAENLIHETSVLQTALNYKCRCCYGQGVLPVEITGIDEELNEIYKPIQDVKLLSYFRSPSFFNYHASAFRDLHKFGNCFPLLVPNHEGTKWVRTDILNARHCRLSEDKTKLLVYGDFALNSVPSNDEKNCVVYDMLDERDPELHLQMLSAHGKELKPVAYPRIRNYLSNNDYYARADWWAAYKSGWITIAHEIPRFLKKAYENAITVMWHIQIPESYYDQHFPLLSYENEAERHKAITDFQQSIEDQLIGTENANKAICTPFTLNELSKVEGFVITRLDNKLNTDEKLSTSAAANSEILFSLMVNPSVLGAGMPGGPYSGNAGSGSDIREGLLVSLILSSMEKSQTLVPVKLMLQQNGYPNIDLKYKNILLTTLDKGKSTEEAIN
jgi:hypothetical protein